MTSTIRPLPMPSGQINIDGSDGLANAINRLPLARGTRKTATRIGTLPNIPTQQFVDTHTVLQHIGRTTTPPHLAASTFTSASAWAWVRYQWAFINSDGMIAPSPDAMTLALHHAAVFSEHLGIGFGLSVVEEVIRTTHPGSNVVFHDFDFLLKGTRASAATVAAPNSRRPDLLAEVRVTGQKSLFYIVECKGTKGSGASSRGQIASGLGQVTGVTVNNSPVPSFVIGTRYSATGVSVQIVDPEATPPEGENMDSAVVTPPILSRETPWEQGRIDVDSGTLARRIVATTTARVLLEAGDDEGASELLGEQVESRFGQVSEVEVIGTTQQTREAVGQVHHFEVGREQYSAFRGAEVDVVRAAREHARPLPERQRAKSQEPNGAIRETGMEPDDQGLLMFVGKALRD